MANHLAMMWYQVFSELFMWGAGVVAILFLFIVIVHGLTE